MAKKSAMSKGYRKTQQKKPFLSKKEIIALIIIVVVVIAAFLVINNLPDGFIGDSAVQEGDILAYGTTKTRDRYVKLGTINELEGYTRTDTKAETTAMVNYTYKPDDEASPINYVTVSGSPLQAESLTKSSMQQLPSYGYTVSDMYETDVQGYKAYVYSSTISYYQEPEQTDDAAAEPAADEAAAESTDAPAEEAPAAEAPAVEADATEAPAADADASDADAEPAPNTFVQDITMYVDCENEHTLALHVTRKGTDESIYMADDALTDYLKPFTEAFTLLPKDAEAK